MTKISNSNPQISRGLYQDICQHINRRVVQQLPDIGEKVRALIITTLNDSPELNELRNPESYLVGVLGLERETLDARVDALVNGISASAEIKHESFRPITQNIIRGFIRVSILKDNYSEILGISEANITYDGGQYNWVRWLVEEGDRIIISDHSVLWKPTKMLTRSRSGHTLMIKQTPNARAARIPGQFSGVPQDNMFTRSFINNQQFQDKLATILYRVFQ